MNIILFILLISFILITIGLVKHYTPECDKNKTDIRVYSASADIYDNNILNQ